MWGEKSSMTIFRNQHSNRRLMNWWMKRNRICSPSYLVFSLCGATLNVAQARFPYTGVSYSQWSDRSECSIQHLSVLFARQGLRQCSIGLTWMVTSLLPYLDLGGCLVISLVRSLRLVPFFSPPLNHSLVHLKLLLHSPKLQKTHNHIHLSFP